ncbi:ethanolamine ammonia-lyase subunit EutC [Sulfurospirillum barnesii]|uniref:Ethanolamine ammonia-lyase small subunit n=1 Tax=Sulfurospirillum barnesii (strain ATCC 700032 / DSM 10660 / SES-3) TaxID=760154 RepID=I3Y0H0_SULBS|nr:ethanolamine ammonia-lyase subunit EutC [Sulfurospirillum barnesii]AFL69694.1 ethanolamine ammonia-lyase, small subunit [Sulfurospirillum barnesii SES-3]
MSHTVIHNPWSALRAYTDARIGLGRSGISIPTHELLNFQLSHAKARDAVHLPLHVNTLFEKFSHLCLDISLLSAQSQKGLLQEGVTPVLLHSQAQNRNTYLQRPDFGRRLNTASKEKLENLDKEESYDVGIVVVDGLSSLAIHENALPFIETLTKELAKDTQAWKLAPFCIVEQGRVAIGDEVGELLHVKSVVVLIGERPGLSSPDSLGLYMTYAPKGGLNDSHRNCISNIRKEGLSYEEAAKKALYLLKESRKLHLSGVAIKERAEEETQEQLKETNFLLN